MWRDWARVAVACSILLSCSDATPDATTHERRTHSSRATRSRDAGVNADADGSADASDIRVDAAREMASDAGEAVDAGNRHMDPPLHYSTAPS